MPTHPFQFVFDLADRGVAFGERLSTTALRRVRALIHHLDEATLGALDRAEQRLTATLARVREAARKKTPDVA